MVPGAEWINDLTDDLRRVAAGTHHDPHGVLGGRVRGGVYTLIAHLPAAQEVTVESAAGDAKEAGAPLPLQRLPDSDFFWWQGKPAVLPPHYRLRWRQGQATTRERVDPYSFHPTLTARDLTAFSAGHEARAWQFLGAEALTVDGVHGVRFAVWAPDALRVSVVGPFCEWDGRCLPMRSLGNCGVWELFVPGLAPGELYKYELRHRHGNTVTLKSDPYGRAGELRPGTASIVWANQDGPKAYQWGDSGWLQARRERNWLHAPLSIYEVHAGSWRRHHDAPAEGAGLVAGEGYYYSYKDLADQLIPYVLALGFTHIELLPITEHPLDDSWGYQTTGYFAPTRRHGTPDELRFFIDHCHRAGIGVLLDWVPAHFPRDAHGLANFDGTALYEYPDPRKAEHRDWGTLIFNYERHEVRSFLISSACYWLEEFHFDGLRVDAVASMIYLDFGRHGDFVRNRHGGRENLEAVELLRSLNATTHARNPGTVIIAEESTDWPQVSRPTNIGGLGFSMKWNMGWMHDTLDYFKEDPINRKYYHNKLSFGQMYAYSENFVLPFSHDEVVHLKRSLLGRMPGDRWQQLANLRLLYTYLWAFPGKKLLFMGSEFAQPWEWNFRAALPWWLTEHAEHAGIQRAVADLNKLYVHNPALHRYEFEPRGFSWLDCDDAAHSVLSFIRWAEHQHIVVALNFTPVPRFGFRLGVPHLGLYREVFNSDSTYYGGGNLGTGAGAQAQAVPWHRQPCSIEVSLPPLAGVMFAAA